MLKEQGKIYQDAHVGEMGEDKSEDIKEQGGKDNDDYFNKS